MKTSEEIRAENRQQFNCKYIQRHARMAELVGAIEDALDDLPHPDAAKTNWGVIGDLGRAATLLEEAAAVLGHPRFTSWAESSISEIDYWA